MDEGDGEGDDDVTDPGPRRGGGGVPVNALTMFGVVLIASTVENGEDDPATVRWCR